MEYGTEYTQVYDTNDLFGHDDSSNRAHSSDRIRDFLKWRNADP